MTDLQDEICDRLVGATIGPNWVGGPLHAAALVMDPSFVPDSRADARPRQFARAVGWPVTFCEAVSGANAALPTEADRRTLAISLFSRAILARPGQRVAAVPGKLSRPAAMWAVLRGHESACSVECPLHAEVAGAVAAVEVGKAWPSFFDRIDCKTAPGKQRIPVRPSSSAAHHAVVAMRYLNGFMQAPWRQYLLLDALRESAKAETKVHGLNGAVAFCLTLAEKLRLPMSGR